MDKSWRAYPIGDRDGHGGSLLRLFARTPSKPKERVKGVSWEILPGSWVCGAVQVDHKKHRELVQFTTDLTD